MSIDEWVGFGIPEEIQAEASAWIGRLDSDTVSPEMRAEFSAWLGEDPMHRWAFEELSALWARVSTLQDMRHLVDDSVVLNFPLESLQKHLPKPPSGPSWWQSSAAIVLIVLGLLMPLAQDAGPALIGLDGHERWSANGE